MTTSNARMEFRLSEEDKALLALAADHCSQSVSDFVRRVAVEAARQSLYENNLIAVTARDMDKLFKMAEQEATSEFKQGLNRFKHWQSTQDDH
ncbi:type II toxin-antitoxin system TacA family antitoxin [Mucisphaera calidilacus]|uniref:DUF1778 domain-containing protein n=1 Tax=Mucisphaera calidilacus TaxID=2527982 RepID=A0A518BV97_9BACT|nr:DUF1778 domain-containing protein [Mucisphaera calidilacus]QDU70881.1 hypothetical protein Pan265_07220 [Mucisphaera calidilacus]